MTTKPNPKLAAYKTMLNELVHDGKTDFSNMEPVEADIIAWAKFESLPSESDEEWIDSALACVDGWGGAVRRGDWQEFQRLLRQGMGHAMADAVQADLDEAAEIVRFNDRMHESRINTGMKWRFQKCQCQ